MSSIIESTRVTELSFLEQILDNQSAQIIGLYGIAGVGKSTLVDKFVRRHSNICLRFDCHLIHPTPKAFSQSLQNQVNSRSDNLKSIRECIVPGTILVLDQFESFHRLEFWLQQEFMPVMAGHLKLLLSGRRHPDNQWVLNPPTNMPFRCLKLTGLSFTAAIDYLQHQGHSTAVALKINQFANGHPLALKLASSAILEQSDLQLNQIPPNNVIHTLFDYFCEEIKTPLLRQALEATSIVRRMSESLLSAMLNIDEASSSEVYQQLAKLDFIEEKKDGLSLHDVIKNVVSSNLKARRSVKYCEYRSCACNVLLNEMKTASVDQLWHYTADILYLVDSKIIRRAFYPPNDHREYRVVPAKDADKQAVMDIIALHEPQKTIELYSNWWKWHVETFRCVKNHLSEIVGFYCLIRPDQVSIQRLQADPITAAWYHHLTQTCAQQPDKGLFIRRWLSHKEGEALSGVQAACWLDIQRTYLEMRAQLRMVYLTLTHLQPYAAIATELGFQGLDTEIEVGSSIYYSAFLDMGEDSVDGWISKRLIHDNRHHQHQEVSSPVWFNKQARQLQFNNHKIDLTPLEFGALTLLEQKRGVAVSRKELLKVVWGIEYEGTSNVVDTIIVSLRKKMHDKAQLIETVRGIGYRYADED